MRKRQRGHIETCDFVQGGLVCIVSKPDGLVQHSFGGGTCSSFFAVLTDMRIILFTRHLLFDAKVTKQKYGIVTCFFYILRSFSICNSALL